MSVISKKTAEHYKWGDNCDGWHFVKSRNLSVIHESMPPNSFEKRHFHKSAEQFFFVLSGIATIELDGESFTVPAASGIHVSAGLKHQMRNNQKDDLVFLVVSTPPSHTDRFDTKK